MRPTLTRHQRAERSRARRFERGERTCGRCNGRGKVHFAITGEVDEDPCRACGGDGKLRPPPAPWRADR